MKKTAFLGVVLVITILTGCDTEHNFMDVENPNAKEDLEHYVSDLNIPEINTDNVIPNNLSGTRNTAKGYANQYYEDSIQDYVDKAKDGFSGAKETIKGYYNGGVDDLNELISDKVNSVISGELNKLKIK